MTAGGTRRPPVSLPRGGVVLVALPPRARDGEGTDRAHPIEPRPCAEETWRYGVPPSTGSKPSPRPLGQSAASRGQQCRRLWQILPSAMRPSPRQPPPVLPPTGPPRRGPSSQVRDSIRSTLLPPSRDSRRTPPSSPEANGLALPIL